MAILKEGWERIKGAFKVILGGAAAFGVADILKGAIKEKGVEAGIDLLKSLATGKGLENEAIYGYILDSCGLNSEERSTLIRAIEELRLGTEKDRQVANNFIILLALGEPDPKTKERPGEKILHGFIHRISEYTTEAEKVQMIKDNIVHIGTDAETKKKIAIVQKWAISAWNEIQGFMGQINTASADFRQDSETELNNFQNRRWWKKIFFN